MGLYIYGARGFGIQVLEHVQATTKSIGGLDEITGFVDDDPSLWGTRVNGLTVIGGREVLLELGQPFQVVFGLASPAAKRSIYLAIGGRGYGTFPCVVSPAASVSPSAVLEDGCVVLGWTGIAAGITLGAGCYVDALCTIGHNTCVGDFCSLMGAVNISGECTIGSDCWLGVKSVILQGLNVGAGATVGAGAVVFRDVPAGATVAGNPARVVPK